jgi:hypothetical protein
LHWRNRNGATLNLVAINAINTDNAAKPLGIEPLEDVR